MADTKKGVASVEEPKLTRIEKLQLALAKAEAAEAEKKEKAAGRAAKRYDKILEERNAAEKDFARAQLRFEAAEDSLSEIRSELGLPQGA